jgi:phosphomannomutase
VDRSALAASAQRVVYDAMYGAGGGVFDCVLMAAGAAVRTLHATPDPDFGGGPPDPIASRLGGLCAAVRETAGPVLGIAIDGDADRFAVIAPDGACLSATDAVALLVDHLATTGRIERGIAISRATGSLAERVAVAHGLQVERHPIGFKFLSEALRTGVVDAAGEESGGLPQVCAVERRRRSTPGHSPRWSD